MAALLLLIAGKAGAQKAYASMREKAYAHTNHVFFKPGESLYYKIYIVNASDNTPSNVSQVAIAELLGPSGALVKKRNVPLVYGRGDSGFQLDPNWPGGVYKLRIYTQWMRNESDSLFFEKSITVQKSISPRVLMKLDFPSKGLGSGDEVVADLEVRNLAGLPIRYQRGTYQVTFAGNIYRSGIFETDEAGKYQFKLRLPDTLATRDGLLNISFNYNGYTENIARNLPLASGQLDMQLMPEGGTLVAGLPNNIAFRAIGVDGQPVDVKGYLRDSKGKQVATFEAYKFGMGRFILTPEAGMTYEAVITSPKNIQQRVGLMPVATQGVVLNVLNDRRPSLKILSTMEQEVLITGTTHGKLIFRDQVRLRKGQLLIPIADTVFPPGIARFTLTGLDNRPLAERVCFLGGNRLLRTRITTDKAVYAPREKVKLSVRTTDQQGRPLPADLSLSVVDDKLWTMADDRQDHLISWLLMSSELRGKVYEPPFYFKKDEEKAAGALDLVMLTHGYRYFAYLPEVRQSGLLKYAPQLGNIFSGIVTDTAGVPVVADVFMIDYRVSKRAVRIATGPDGKFFFSAPTAANQLLVIAKSRQAKQPVKINMEKSGSSLNAPLPESVFMDDAVTWEAQAQQQDIRKGEELFANKIKVAAPDQALSETVVVGYGVQRREALTGAVSSIRSIEVAGGNLTGALQGRAAGIMIRGAGAATPSYELYGSRSAVATEPLFIVDGLPVDKLNASLNMNDVTNVYVLKDAAATAIYGSRGANGVILITTNYGGGSFAVSLNKRYYYALENVLNWQEHDYERLFYAPNYGYDDDERVKNDFRETIYWNGTVQTNKDGKADLEFYNSDANTTFRVIAEGLSYDGKPGRAEVTYAAQSPLSADIKVPPYLTVGDSAMLPLVLKNNRDTSVAVKLALWLPDGFSAGNYQDSLVLGAGESRRVLLPVAASKAVGGVLRLGVTTGKRTERLEWPVSAGAKGFPVVTTLGGTDQVKKSFEVRKALPGSVVASLGVFNDLAEQLSSGIDDMLREPHGCFEQTASAAYPNIYILRYLRSNGKANFNKEDRALKYLQQGYNKMAGYEVKHGGFSWFGEAPAKVALTAYGLLVFKEMKEFIPVDSQLLVRTRDFLLARRDGRGGFRVNSDAAPDAVQDMYIVYALSQAGYGEQVKKEYEVSAAKTATSGDGYRLALAALAAHNMGKLADYDRFLQLLAACKDKPLMGAVSGFTGSRGEDLEVEARALYALALMRAVQPDQTLVTEQLSKLRRLVSGYGNTQSISLSLNAITTYSRQLLKHAMDGQISLTLNGRAVTPKDSIAGFIREGENTVDVHFGPGERTPYKLAVGYYTLLPPDSEGAAIHLQTKLQVGRAKAGETVRLQVEVKNTSEWKQPMVAAQIGIPAGLSLQPWQLKQLQEQHAFDYYEMFNNYLVFYWTGMEGSAVKNINLDLKAEIPGVYTGKASNAYLYYMSGARHWNPGLSITVE